MPHSTLGQLPLWALMALVLVSAVWVVTLRNLFRAALSLGLALLGIAGLFVWLEAEFVAFVQVLIYVGAILTLIVFAIMLTEKLPAPQETPASRRALAALASAALFVLLASLMRVLSQAMVPAPEALTLPQLGRELITTLALPFEVIGLVFVAAMIGAIALASTNASGARDARAKSSS